MTAPFWLTAARLGLSPFPAASHVFRHYLNGRGRSVTVNTRRLLQDDENVSRHVSAHIMRSLNDGQVSGTVDTPQPIFTNWNWRLALGRLQLQWERINDDVVLHFTKTYHWTPQTRRLSRPIHRAASQALNTGACNFPIHGHPARVSIQSMESAGMPRKARFLGRLHL